MMNFDDQLLYLLSLLFILHDPQGRNGGVTDHSTVINIVSSTMSMTTVPSSAKTIHVTSSSKQTSHTITSASSSAAPTTGKITIW